RRLGAARGGLRGRRAEPPRGPAGPGGEAAVKALLAVVVAVGGVLGVGELADLTQNRPDPVVEGSVTTVVFDVGTRRCRGTDDEAAAALWAVCAASVPGTATGPTAPADGPHRGQSSP